MKETHPQINDKSIWNSWYASHGRDNLSPNDASWLEPWWHLIEPTSSPILDLGCGRGIVSKYLTDRGKHVISADYAEEALKIVPMIAPSAKPLHLDMRDLPFSDRSFDLVIASLSLHYFAWETTLKIVEDLHRKLRDGGCLIAWVNAKSDRVYQDAVAQNLPVIEQDYRLVRGSPRRYFDEESLLKLFSQDWEIIHLVEKPIKPYNSLKNVWEFVCKKEL